MNLTRLLLRGALFALLVGCSGGRLPTSDDSTVECGGASNVGGNTSTVCDGCTIDGSCVLEGSENPDNACQVCTPSENEKGWSDRPDGSTCSDGEFCTGGDVCEQGECKAGEKDPCDDGVSCNGAESCNEDEERCVPAAATCDAGTTCDLASDSCEISCAGCAIDGVCYANGTPNPLNACEVCDAQSSKTEFSTAVDGTVCDDGAFCNGVDVCAAGVCAPGDTNPCNDGVDCNGEEVCNEDSNSCGPDASTCAAGTVCVTETDTCEITCAGCVVDGVCYADGSPNPANACEACDVDASQTEFSAVPNGIVCDNGVFCDGTDTCQDGACTEPDVNPCDDGVACNGSETCDEDANSCGAGTSTCGDGTSCQTGTDTCEITCAGCVVDGVCYADGSPNPLNACQLCDVDADKTAFSDAVDGALCNDGLFCNGMDACVSGVCVAAGTNPCNDGVACNGTESCNESADSCAPGSATCGAGEVCDVDTDTCEQTCNGCTIAGVCYPDGVTNPTSACEVCSVSDSLTSWSALADGDECGLNAECSAGVCECEPGWIESGGYCTTQGITAADETWTGDVFVGIQATIPKVNLLANDVNNLGQHSELVIVAVKDATNGTVSMNGTNVFFTGAATGPGSFTYVVQAGSDPSTQVEVTVSFTVSPAPAVIAVDDSRTVQQGESLPITAASLLANDVGTSLTVISVQNPVRGTVNLVGTAITFQSTGIAGEPAEFQYTVQNGSGVQATGKVFITATPLPGVGGYIYDDFALFDSKRTTYSPPTVRSIFNTWGRFDNNTYFPGGSTPTGTAASWTLIADENNNGNIDGDLDLDGIQDNKTSFTNGGFTINGDIDGNGTFDARFMQTANGSYNGFISPQSYANYTHEVTLWSLNTDDDMVGVAIAYDTGGGAGVLHVDRTAGGYAPTAGWGLLEGTTVIVNFGVNGTFANSGGGTGWNSRASRVRIVRTGDLIQAYCTNWMSTVSTFFSPPAFNPDSLIEIDLSTTTNNIRWSVGGVPQTASRDLTRFRGAHPYGYVNASQAQSSYIDVKFDGGIQSDVLVYLKDKQSGVNIWNQSEVWRYLSGAWTMTAESAQDVFGFVRPVTEPETGNVYQIRATEIEKL